MTQPSGSNPTASAFTEHVRAFHHGLPNDEKQLLEQIFALAEAASSALSVEGDEARGYALVDHLYKGGIEGESSDSKHKGEGQVGIAYKELGVKLPLALTNFFRPR
jgi:hypothetical protein